MIWLMNWVVKAVIQVLLLITITRLWTENCWFSRIITSISASWAIYKWKQFYGTHNLIYILGCIQFSTIFARGLIQISEMTRAVHGLRHVLFLSIETKNISRMMLESIHNILHSDLCVELVKLSGVQMISMI